MRFFFWGRGFWNTETLIPGSVISELHSSSTQLDQVSLLSIPSSSFVVLKPYQSDLTDNRSPLQW